MKLPIPGQRSEEPVPKNAYRNSALLYAALAGVLVAVTVFTGGSLLRGLLVGIGCFVLATAWTWWRFREREQFGREGE